MKIRRAGLGSCWILRFLKAVINACGKESQHQQQEQQDELVDPKQPDSYDVEDDALSMLSKAYDDDKYDADIGEDGGVEEEVEEEVEEVMLTSQSNNQYSDDSNLEMDD